MIRHHPLILAVSTLLSHWPSHSHDQTPSSQADPLRAIFRRLDLLLTCTKPCSDTTFSYWPSRSHDNHCPPALTHSHAYETPQSMFRHNPLALSRSQAIFMFHRLPLVRSLLSLANSMSHWAAHGPVSCPHLYTTQCGCTLFSRVQMLPDTG
jgi:hypothetical protein